MTQSLPGVAPVAFALPPDIETPAVVVDLDVVERNARSMAAALAARGILVRPHVKTHKCVALARLQIALGATGITVGTTGEAEVMAAGGLDDIFIAYPVWATGDKAGRIRHLHETIDLRVGVDSPEGARLLGASVGASDRALPVLIEVDSGEGRTGVCTPERAVAVALASREAGLDVRGVFTHGGHAYRGPDARRAAARDEAVSMAAAAAALRTAGFTIDELSAGSTPTALLAEDPAITEMRPGTYIFGDRQQVALGSVQPDEIGLVIAATVVSSEQPGCVVVDAGAKILARDKPHFLDGLGAVPSLGAAIVERAYDYHGVIPIPPEVAAPRLGEMLAIVPNHVCPVVNLVDELVVVRAGRVVDRWRVDARGMNG